MFRNVGFRHLNLPRPVYLVDDSVMFNKEENVIKGRALFPSSDPTLEDRRDGHVNVQHFAALGSNLFHTLLAARGEEPKKVRVLSEKGTFIREVRQDIEIDVVLGFIIEPYRTLDDGTPVYKGNFSGELNGEKFFDYSYDVMIV